PLPSMALLAHTLALLAMAVATVVVNVVTLDMEWNSFDDQYLGCVPAMTEALPALNRSELQQNPVFAQAWAEAVAEWQNRGSHVPPLSPDQLVALRAFIAENLYEEFTKALRTAGRSRQEYRDNFHFKTLHFLLTQALGRLREAQKGQCQDVFWEMCDVQRRAWHGDIVRFGLFLFTSLRKLPAHCLGKRMVLQVHTCHGAEMEKLFEHLVDVVVIPPFETFEVTDVTEEGNTTQIQLHSTGTFSNYNCEWLRGDSTGDSLGD
ncbi:NARE ribosyltransferase, partial [Sitta europaea]|nr:NARE ribosyltransferase [Sitta europaea]